MITKFSTVLSPFTVPAKGGTISIDVSNTGWMMVGDFVHVRGGGNFVVSTISGNRLTLTYYGSCGGNDTAGNVVKAGSGIMEGAKPATVEATDPSKVAATSILDGGTGAVTAEQARTNLGVQTIQVGTATLVSGTVTVSTANIGSDSKVFVTRTAIPGGAATGEIGLAVLGVSTGNPGSFTITAIDKDGATVTNDDATVNWMVVG